MTDPKLATHPRIAIWEADFSKYVSEHYGRPYRLQQQGDMMAQEASIRFSVPPTDWYDENPTLAEWQAATPPAAERPDFTTDREGWQKHLDDQLRWDRDYYPDLETVVKDLYEKGLLDAGDYIIYAWW